MRIILGTAIGVVLLLAGAVGVAQANWQSEVTFGAITLRYEPVEDLSDNQTSDDSPTPTSSDQTTDSPPITEEDSTSEDMAGDTAEPAPTPTGPAEVQTVEAGEPSEAEPTPTPREEVEQ